MTDRPIIFSGPMVRALLEGRKTQTRRALKPQPGGVEARPNGFFGITEKFSFTLIEEGGANSTQIITTPYAPGGRLWVRETWQQSGLGWDRPSPIGRAHFRADPEHGWKDYWGRWRSPIHMPRWASRLTLIVTDVRVQRVQEITAADAADEGIRYEPGSYELEWFTPNARDARRIEDFAALWNSLNAKRGLGWDANPWVVALTFTVHRCNIDKLGEHND